MVNLNMRNKYVHFFDYSDIVNEDGTLKYGKIQTYDDII